MCSKYMETVNPLPELLFNKRKKGPRVVESLPWNTQPRHRTLSALGQCWVGVWQAEESVPWMVPSLMCSGRLETASLPSHQN